jgi:integrase/recombinase XerD
MSKPIKHNRKDGQEAYRIYYFDHNSTRRSKVIVGKMKKAQDTLRRIEVNVQDIKNGIAPSPIGRMSTQTVVNKYLKMLSHSQTKDSTIKRYETSLNVFIGRLKDSKLNQIGTISYADIEDYKTHRLETCTNAGVNIDLRALRAFFNYCVRMDFVSSSPYNGVKPVKEIAKDVRFLSSEEISDLLKEIKLANDDDMYDLIRFYLNTGARAREILSPLFTWDSVKPEYIELFGKGDKTRRIGLSDSMRDILERRRHLESPFPYNHDYVYSRIVRKYYDRVDINNANLHTLRKTAGALLIQQGVDIYRVSRFLGHASVTVTERHYVDLLQDDYTVMSESIESALNNISEPKVDYEWRVAV